MKELIKYHLHSDYSLLDSCTNYKDYIDEAVKNGERAIAFTEHGKISGWVGKKMYCDKVGVKYIHGVECYLTESLDEQKRDNYHTVLLARNYEGVEEINRAISIANSESHFFYTGRITFDEFINLSHNVICTSACLASPLNKLDINHPYYEKLVKRYDYLEIQPHNHPEQIRYNGHLSMLSRKYGIPLIAGTDTHSLNQYKADCRSILLKAKRQSYGDEDLFDLTYRNYDEVFEAFRAQGLLSDKFVEEAMDNTVKLADSIESFELDTTIKYPILYGSREADREKFRSCVQKKFQDKMENGIIPEYQIPAFKSAIQEEMRVFNKINMDGFMLSMSEFLTWCRDNGIPVGPARGSVGGSRVAYITDIIDLNPETWHTVFSRFCNEDRKEVGDIDVDIIKEDRPKIFEYIINRFGKRYTARVASYGTLQEDAVIDEITRALSFINPNDKRYSLENTKRIKAEYKSDSDKCKAMYPEVFKYFDGLLGTKISQSVHPAGIVVSPVTLDDHYGVFDKDGISCMMLNMDEVHEIGLVKYDFLVLKNIKIISDTCAAAGIPYPASHRMNWEDQEVWKDMLRSPIGIFQFEESYAHSLLRKYGPHSIFDMSLVTAAIRPSGASYRDDLIAHKPYKNPSSIIDELLKDNNGYLIYQEDTIKFLQQICGMSGSEADNVRRAIGRKDKERLEKALPDILNGYCAKSDKPKEEAEKEAKAFLRIIEDSASYQFGLNHSIAYCLIGYICAYLRYYYPAEFICSYLNNAANNDDVSDGQALAHEYGIEVLRPKFGLSKAKYSYNREKNIIVKGIGSVKNLNDTVGDELFKVSQHLKDTVHFVDTLYLAKKDTSVKKNQIDILIKLDYFSQYGEMNVLLKINEEYEKFQTTSGFAKLVKKEKLDEWERDIIASYATDRKKDGSEMVSFKIIRPMEMLRAFEDYIRSQKIVEIDIRQKMSFQLDYLGYIDMQTGKSEDRRKLYVMSLFKMKDKRSGEIWGIRIDTRSIGTGKTASLTVPIEEFEMNPFRCGDLIFADDVYKNRKGYWYLSKYRLIA